MKTIGGSITAAATVGAVTTSAAAGSYTSHSYGGITYAKYVPDDVDGSEAVPLVMMLHGCTQSADGFKDGTGMNEVADEEGFIVVYPEENSHPLGCFRWYDDQHTTRDSGEAATLAGIVGDVESDHDVDGDSVYVAGFSAGGAMVSNLAVEYADVFDGVAIHSGLEYDAAESSIDGTAELTSCSDDSQAKGDQAYEAMESYGIARKIPTIVFHGTDDDTVYTCNGHQAAACFTQANDLAIDDADDDVPSRSPDSQTTGSGPSLSYTQSDYYDENGDPIVRKVIVDGMSHAWSGGTQGGSYTAPGGPDASRMLFEFLHESSDEPEPGLTASASASPTDAEPGESITFDGSDSSFTDGSIESFQWDFDDGDTASGETVTHSYESPGTYDATLTVGAGDQTDSDTVTVTVDDAPDLYCGTATNSQHVDAGRAYASWGCYYAEGSEDYLGCIGAESTTLEETSEGYFEETSSCDDDGDDDCPWYGCW